MRGDFRETLISLHLSSLKRLYEFLEIISFSEDENSKNSRYGQRIQPDPVPHSPLAHSHDFEEKLELAEEEEHQKGNKNQGYFKSFGLYIGNNTSSTIFASIRLFINFLIFSTLSRVAVVSSSSLRKFIRFYRYF